ncbi:MAG TPA: SDR family oxidoreductase [Candidatus Latescibacteria bacterium]|nr:SDR family oxidoreductase [Candidatus Latescibacterota bacterium]
MKLTDKIAVITGGATGIGGATAELFAAEGAVALVLDYCETEGPATVERIRRAGGKAAFYRIDVRSEPEGADGFKRIAEAYGRVDILVCSAGVLTGAYRGIGELSEEDWNATLDTNLKGTYLTAKHAAPLLELAGETVLLLIASGAGVHGGSSSFAYAASKAGIHGMYHNFVNDLGSKGTRVHVICPGGIATPLKLKNVAEGARARGEDAERAVEAASQNLGDPMGVARVLAFLASDDGSYVRGTVFTR